MTEARECCVCGCTDDEACEGGCLFWNTDAGVAAGVRGGSPLTGGKGALMLSSTAKTNIAVILEALVNANAHRPEDDAAVQTALADLKTEVEADEGKETALEGRVTDLEGRVTALEDVDNGVEAALEPQPQPEPAPEPAQTASVSTTASLS